MAAQDNLNPQQFPEHARRWVMGDCATYAQGLHELRPDLHMGVLTHAPEGENAFESDSVHYFMHDEHKAYDALGAHPMPYHGSTGGFPRAVTHMDAESYSPADMDYGIGGRNKVTGHWYDNPERDQAIAQAKAHAVTHDVLRHDATKDGWA